ncbi:pyridine nucleotide-disulfide oxidoreductase [Agromyces binzhouensis]|uniref:Pyridine nucleotide-disulfide oxidoreductase n=2 Tax=Agromyces binzhouensis TaxID=1817495 RepID=A0A4Q2JPP7_9MICO|nr:pyridine nucleotide-disulfide oxidoreductase [Agromyces binzhouensis]
MIDNHIPHWGIPHREVIMSSEHALIVGAGAAGWSAADTLVRSGWPGPVTIVDPTGPTNRTLVNKGVLTGLLGREQLGRPIPAGTELLEDEVAAVQADGTVHLRSGDRVAPTAVVIATGSAPRRHSFSPDGDAGAERILPLHSIEDAERIRSLLPSSGGRVAVLGAGLIGSETASLLADSGVDVTLLARSPLPLRDQLGPTVASDLLRRHRDRIRIRTGRDVARAATRSDIVVVELSDGETVEADVAIVAHGTLARRPSVGAQTGALTVDARLRTGLRGVYAAGGVASILSHGTAVRVDHWEDAAAQGAHAARSILHDLLGAADPGEYRFESGFSARIHGGTLTAWGVATRATQWSRHDSDEAVGVGRHFGQVTAVAGIDAAGTVRSIVEAARRDLREPLHRYPIGV